MDVIEKAIEIENKGEEIYRNFAKESNDTGLKEIFSYLAGEEAKHRKTFKDMASEKEVTLADSKVIDKVKDIFKKMSHKSSEVNMDNYEVEIYKKALDVEQKSIDYYSKIAGQVKDNQKEIVEKIKAEEKKHYRIIENIIEFANRPQQWLDDAEWYHLEEY